jgi:hypothetical protein
MIDAIRAAVAGSADAAAIIIAVIGLILIILYFVALISIITKAGYSGAWVLITFVPVVAWVITSLVVYDQTKNSYYSTFDWNAYVWAWTVDAIAYLVPVVLFFIFAFSEWPVQKKLRALQGAGVVMAPAVPRPASMATMPSLHSMPAQPPTPAASPAVSSTASAPARGTTMQATPPATSVAQFCIHCGGRNSADAEYCGTCGTRLET